MRIRPSVPKGLAAMAWVGLLAGAGAGQAIAPAGGATPAGRVLLSAPNPATGSQFVAPGQFFTGPS